MEEKKEIKVGDTVLVYGSNLCREHLDVVAGETKTCWRVGATLYKKDNLAEKGGSVWSRTLIRLPNDADIKRVIRINRITKVFRFFSKQENVENLDDDMLVKLSIFIDKQNPKK